MKDHACSQTSALTYFLLLCEKLLEGPKLVSPLFTFWWALSNLRCWLDGSKHGPIHIPLAIHEDAQLDLLVLPQQVLPIKLMELLERATNGLLSQRRHLVIQRTSKYPTRNGW